MSNENGDLDTKDGGEEEGDEDLVRHRVCIMGFAGVGKSSLVQHFLESKDLNTFDLSLDEDFCESYLSIDLDGDVSHLTLIDHKFEEMSIENSFFTYDPQVFVIVYSVEDRGSFETAKEMLEYLRNYRGCSANNVRIHGVDRAVILVGNKVDLQRCRVVTPKEGKDLAGHLGAKFIETSSGIGHNVDQLLVGIVKQMKFKEETRLRDSVSMGAKRSGSQESQSAMMIRRASSPLRTLQLAGDILAKMCLGEKKPGQGSVSNLMAP